MAVGSIGWQGHFLHCRHAGGEEHVRGWLSALLAGVCSEHECHSGIPACEHGECGGKVEHCCVLSSDFSATAAKGGDQRSDGLLLVDFPVALMGSCFPHWRDGGQSVLRLSCGQDMRPRCHASIASTVLRI